MTFHRLQILFIISVLFFLTACNSSSSSTAATSAAESFPSGMAVASPTATADTSTLIVGPIGFLLQGVDAPDPTSGYLEKIEVFETVTDAAADSACEVTLPGFTALGDPLCYGPQLDYQNHTDGMPSSGQLPGGDLGIWTASADTGEACTAAKINALIQGTASNVDYIMLLTASMVCLMERSSTTPPATDGASVDLSSELNTVIQVNNSDVTITTATIENLADVTDTDSTVRDVYLFSLVVVDATGPNSITIEAFMKHMPTSADNSTYKGKMWAEFDGISAGDKSGLAVQYEKASDSDLRYKMLAADYQAATDTTVIFDSNGNLAIDGDWSGNLDQTVINLDPTTGYGNFSYAWQAGTGDDRTRIFNGYTNATGGCGFFGFGLRFDNSTGETSDNVIDGMICNWAGPNNDHSMSSTANLAQKQCMTINTTTGLFELDATRNDIAFAPTVLCVGDGSMQVKRAVDSTYDVAVTTHDLVDLTTDADFANYTAPTAPDLPTGF